MQYFDDPAVKFEWKKERNTCFKFCGLQDKGQSLRVEAWISCLHACSKVRIQMPEHRQDWIWPASYMHKQFILLWYEYSLYHDHISQFFLIGSHDNSSFSTTSYVTKNNKKKENPGKPGKPNQTWNPRGQHPRMTGFLEITSQNH